MIPRNRLLAAVSVSLLLSLVALACSSDSETAAPAAAQVAPPAAATAPAAVLSDPSPTPAPAPSAEVEASVVSRDDPVAPELVGLKGWANSEPFTLESQRGNVVLIDFWTYTCINCIRTLPYLREWNEKYADHGLVILGVHAPEFEFEKVRENVIDAMEKHGIEYAVAQDNEMETWSAFNNRFWPAKYMIDKDGYIRYTHFGEGAYLETEEKIRELLTDAGADLVGISPNTSPEPGRAAGAEAGDVNQGLTRELYAGYDRNYGSLRAGQSPPYVLHQEYYKAPNVEVLYEDPGDYQNHFMYLNGLWLNGEESLVHARETTDYEDHIALVFFATSVNGVMAPVGADSFKLRVELDGGPLPLEKAGPDVMFADDGESFVIVDEARLYRIVDQQDFSSHELRLSSNSKAFSLFAFTFGGYEGGEPIS